MYGMLVPSGCDAANCLAFHVGRFLNSEKPIEAFIKKM